MKVASPLLLVSALFIAFSAGSQPTPADSYKSTLSLNCSGECTVLVTVPAGCGSGIRVAPDPIVVPKNRATRITWKVHAPWKFDRTSGVHVHMGSAPSFTGFERLGTDGDSFKVVINHGTRATFKYDINLEGPGGPCRLDPTIVNW
jgi:hypothetical protein